MFVSQLSLSQFVPSDEELAGMLCYKHRVGIRGSLGSAQNTLDCKGDWAQDSRRILSYITVCGYDTTHLQENPQRLG